MICAGGKCRRERRWSLSRGDGFLVCWTSPGSQMLILFGSVHYLLTCMKHIFCEAFRLWGLQKGSPADDLPRQKAPARRVENNHFILSSSSFQSSIFNFHFCFKVFLLLNNKKSHHCLPYFVSCFRHCEPL